jgi:hypothetical protein
VPTSEGVSLSVLTRRLKGAVLTSEGPKGRRVLIQPEFYGAYGGLGAVGDP